MADAIDQGDEQSCANEFADLIDKTVPDFVLLEMHFHDNTQLLQSRADA
jgi:hypothetical protein